FLTVIKTYTPYDSIWNTVLDKYFFNRSALGIGPVQNRIITKLSTAINTVFYSAYNCFALTAFTIHWNDLDRQSVTAICPEFLVAALFVFGDNRMRRVQNMFGTTVVLLQLNDRAVWIIFFKV